MIGVYAIRNTVTNEIYVGSTTTKFSDRWDKHVSELDRNVHKNSYLQVAWNKYKEYSFEFIILEVCTKEECLSKEQYWIDYYKSYERIKGYNIRPYSGNGQWAEESKEKLSKSRTGVKRPDVSIAKKGQQYNVKSVQQWKDDTLIKTWSSVIKASEGLGITKTNIAFAANGKRPSAGGFKWKYS